MPPHEIQLAVDRLVAAFHRAGDRFAHRIGIRVDDRVAWLLRSLEGDPGQPWPSSPPLQELSPEKRPGGRVLLGVGMAGRSHWSLSVEPLAGECSLVFEAACRAQTRPPLLASTYALAPEAQCRPTRAGIEVLLGPLVVRLGLVEAGRSGRLGAADLAGSEPACGLTFDPQTSRVQIRPLVQETAWPRTIRWRYQVRA